MAPRVRSARRLLRIFAVLSAAWALLWPTIANPAGVSAIPIVSLGAGDVTVESATSASHKLVSVEPLQSRSSLKTGLGAHASVSLEGVGTVRIGPATSTSVTTGANGLTFALEQGALCVHSQVQSVGVWVGDVEVTPSSQAAIFDVRGDSNSLTLGVFVGEVSVRHGSERLTQRAGSALVIGADGTGDHQVLLRPTVASDFATLDCPDPQVIASAEAASAPVEQPSGGGHGSGGIIGAILGLVAVAAAFAGHGGGGSSSTSTTAQPTVPPTSPTPPKSPPPPPPTPTPTPGPLLVSTNTIAIVGIGSNMPFTASETNYTGVLSAVSSNPAAATVSGVGNGPGPVTFTATAVAVGNVNITVSDDHAGQQVVFASVTTGTMTVDPQTLSLPGPQGHMKFTATDISADEKTVVSATSSDPTIAIVSPTTQGGKGPFKFTVSAGPNRGKATIMVSDENGMAAVSVGVGVPPLRNAMLAMPTPKHPIVSLPQPSPRPLPKPTALSRLALNAANLRMAGPAQTAILTASELGYSGPITATVVGPSVVDIDHASGPGPTQTFKLTSRTVGTTTVRVYDDHGNSVLVSVMITPIAPTPSPTLRPAPTPPPAPRPQGPSPLPKPPR